MAFKPGQSGNPGGRPKGLRTTVREVCGDFREQVARMRLISLGLLKGFTGRDQIEATKWLADRGEGKALETSISVQGELEDLGANLEIAREQIADLARHLRSVDRQADQSADPSADPQVKVA